MSVEALAIALHHSRSKTATSKLVLLGVANHDGDGGAWPSMTTLARYAVCSVRQAQRAVDELERLGEVRRIVQAGGTRHTADYARPNLYEFLLRCPPDCDRSKNHRTRHQPALMVDLDGLAEPVDNQGPGDMGVTGGVTPMSPKPIPRTVRDKEEPDQPQTARAITRRGWDHRCVDGSDGHRISRKTGACAYCGARRTTWEETDQ